MKAAKETGETRIRRTRVRLKAYDHEVVDQSCMMVVQAVRSAGAKVSGPVLMPVEISAYRVLRDPEGGKEQGEVFQLRNHVRIIDILEPSPQIMEMLAGIDLPAGVDIEMQG